MLAGTVRDVGLQARGAVSMPRCGLATMGALGGLLRALGIELAFVLIAVVVLSTFAMRLVCVF